MDNGLVVVVTGGSSGVGRATVREFARRGARVAVLARGRDGLKAARDEVENLGGQALDITVDVAHAEQVERAAQTIDREFGPPDVWVNNAMTSVFSPVKDLSPEEVRRVTEVTYLGVVNCTLTALKRMLARDRGVIVQVGSALSHRAIPLQAAYCGAKHAIEGFTEALRTELLHDRSRVRLSMVQLPGLNTPQFDVVKSRLPRRPQPVPPIYEPELAAKAIVWAAQHDRRELYVGGSTAAIILLNKLAPGLLDRYLARTNYDAQQTDQSEDPDRPFNLWDPVPSDRGARGRFSDRSKARSYQLWATTHRRPLGAVLALSGAAGLAVQHLRRSWAAVG
jgi:NAD(P)-dependent dehydrogenase (short-subunit alcohol dehydrogenase family)